MKRKGPIVSTVYRSAYSTEYEADMKPLRVSEDFVPIGEFKAHAAKVLKRLNELKRSIVITQHGKPAAVLITPEEFDYLRYQIRFIDAYKEGMADIAAGRVTSHEDFEKELKEEFGE